MAYKSANFILLFFFSSFLISCGHDWNNPCDQNSPSYSERECSIQQRGCPDDCSPADSRQCSGNGYQVCGNYDSDPCLEWGTVTACVTGETCVSGQCITPPSAPSNLHSTVTSSTQINLSWTDNSNNEDGFKIERKIGAGGIYAQAATVSARISSYLDTGLICDTDYYYRVRAYNGAGDSGYSGEVNKTSGACPPDVPAAPSNLQITLVSSLQINLSWNDNSDDEDGFKIERKTGSGGTYIQVGKVGSEIISYQDSITTCVTIYYYRVRAFNGLGDSTNSNETNTASILCSPLNLQATAVSPSQIDLNWTDNSSNENGFKVERKKGAGGTYSMVYNAAANTTAWSDSGLSAISDYSYRVYAYNSASSSDYSNEVNVTTQGGTWSPTSITNAPSKSNYCAVVWTGSEMIVWGGWDGSFINTGGRYNPAIDLWTATSTGTNVPSARYRHKSIWTGLKMIIWGGEAVGGLGFNTGGLYDPSTDSWTPTGTGTNVPMGRCNHTAVWTGTEMIVWGGDFYNGLDVQFTNSGGRYNPSTDSWAPTSTGTNVPSPRSWQHTAVWTGTEMIVWGGTTYDGSPPTEILNSGGRYNPSADSWTPTSTRSLSTSLRHPRDAFTVQSSG